MFFDDIWLKRRKYEFWLFELLQINNDIYNHCHCCFWIGRNSLNSGGSYSSL